MVRSRLDALLSGRSAVHPTPQTDRILASGVRDDEGAERAAFVEPWSYSQTEGQFTKFKLVKQQMYGRGKIDLLRPQTVQ